VTRAGASWAAKSNGGHQGEARTRRWSDNQAPTAARWTEATAVLMAALAAIARAGHPETAAVAVTALTRAGEAVPQLFRSPEIKAAVAIGSTLTETKLAPPTSSSPQSLNDDRLAELMATLGDMSRELAALRLQTANPAKSRKSTSRGNQLPLFADAGDHGDPEPLPPRRSEQPAVTDEIAELRAELAELKRSSPTTPPAAPPGATRPLTAAELVERIRMLEGRKLTARRRGDAANARTVGTQLTTARRKLRALLRSGEELDPKVVAAAEHVLGQAEVVAQSKYNQPTIGPFASGSGAVSCQADSTEVANGKVTATATAFANTRAK